MVRFLVISETINQGNRTMIRRGRVLVYTQVCVVVHTHVLYPITGYTLYGYLCCLYYYRLHVQNIYIFTCTPYVSTVLEYTVLRLHVLRYSTIHVLRYIYM